MIRNWISLALWTALLLLFGLGDSRAIHHRQEDLPSVVFRGDMRAPDAVRAAGGFYPRDPMDSLGRELTAEEVERSASLYYHHTGTTYKFTKYVSTSTDPEVGRLFGTPFRAAQDDVQESGYLYRISADPKMVDMVGSVGKENMIARYVSQAEQAVAGGVPFEQIEGWYKIDDITDEKMAAIKNGEKLEGDILQVNDKFNPKYTPLRASGKQHQLAGFANKRKGKKLRKTEPWSKYQDKSVDQYLEEFQKKVGALSKAPVSENTAAAAAAEAGGEAVAASEASTATEVFVAADPLGARDLIGALEAGEPAEGLMSVDVMELGTGAAEIGIAGDEVVEIAVEASEANMSALEAAEAAEAGEAFAAAEIASGEAVSVLAEIFDFLLIVLK